MFDKNTNIEQLQKFSKNTMVEALGIEFLDLGNDFISARMPVDRRTHQPMGILHGGASVALAETLGSIASSLLIDLDRFNCVGIEINANHLKTARNGFVTGKATPIHIGKKTHIWEIKISNENNDLVCISRLTVMIIKKK